MLYAIARLEGQTTGGAFWKDLKTVAGYVHRASRNTFRMVQPGQHLVLQVYQSEHPDHPYGNDKLVHTSRMLNNREFAYR